MVYDDDETRSCLFDRIDNDVECAFHYDMVHDDVCCVVKSGNDIIVNQRSRIHGKGRARIFRSKAPGHKPLTFSPGVPVRRKTYSLPSPKGETEVAQCSKDEV